MKIKLTFLLLISSFCLLFIGAAIAGSTETKKIDYYGPYLDLEFGYAFQSYEDDTATAPGASAAQNTLTSPRHLNGSYIGAGDLGFQINRNWAFEAAWYYLPKAQGIMRQGRPFTIRSQLVYVAVKYIFPVSGTTSFFGKFGAGWTYNYESGPPFPTTDNATSVFYSRYTNPIFGAGVQHYISEHTSVNLQYLYFPGFHRSSSTDFFTPSANILVGGVGYKFY